MNLPVANVTLSLLVLCLSVSVTQFVWCQTETDSVSLELTTTAATTTTEPPSTLSPSAKPIEVITPSKQDDIISPKPVTDKSGDHSESTTTERNDLDVHNRTAIAGDKATGDINAGDKIEEPEEEEKETEELGDEENADNNSPEKNEGENSTEEEEEEEPEEESGDFECTFNQFLSGLNISHYLPEDRGSLRDEYESFQDGHDAYKSPSVNHTIQRLKRLLNYANGITSRQELRSGFASFIQHNYDLFLELELDAPCMSSLISVIAAIRRQELWAIKFIDSMAKPPPGLLSGVTSFLGDFDQCLSVKSPETANEEFSGQYCLLRPILPLPDVRKYTHDTDEHLIGETKLLNYLSSYNLDRYVQTNPVLKFIEHMKTHNGRVLNFAICLPDLCSPKQLEKSFNRLLYPIVGIPFEIHNSSCWTLAKTKDVSFHMNRYTQFAIFTLSFVTVIVTLSTLYELYSHRFLKQSILAKTCAKSSSSKTANSLVYVFSAISNTRRLLSPGTSRIAVLDTLRLVIIILIGLTTAFYNTPLSSGLRKMSQSVPYELLSDSKYFFIRAPALLNDGLLVIAGALFVRSVFRHLNSPNDNFSYILYFFRRWLRLTAPLFGSILFLLILPLTGFGPLWDRMVDILLPACESPSSLTSSLLHYSNWNFVKSNHSNADAYVVCNPNSFFISILFQLNIAFFMIVVLVYQSPRNGLRLLVLFIVASLALNVSPRIFHSNTRTYYELTKQPSLWHLRRNFYLYHQNIIQYVGSFSVGLLLGYAIVVHENKKHHPEPDRKTTIYNWLSVATIVAIYAWVNQFFQQNTSPAEASVLLFFSFGRLAFSLAFAWIIYSCVSNKSATFLNILSTPSLQPLARLSFCIFLVQNLVQYHRMYSIKDTYVMTFRGTIENFIIDFAISSVVAYALYLLFEGPCQRLNELFCGRDDNSDYADSNKAYMFDGQLRNGKPLSSTNGERMYHNEAPSTQHLNEKGHGNGLTHRSKVIDERNARTAANANETDEFADSGIITIRF